ncbi:MAG: molybdopterin-guanine dinucleotide biosynthesis protein B [Oscillospiraceae bacterium]
MADRPVLLAVSGVKNSGKTTLIERLLPLLAKNGLRTAVIKHDGHGFTPDTPETDSFRFFSAGACGAAVFDGEKFSLTCRASVSEKELIALFPDADLILLEGFKSSEYKKLELVRGGVSVSPVCNAQTCIALVSDLELVTKLPLFHPDAVEDIAAFITKYTRNGAYYA